MEMLAATGQQRPQAVRELSIALHVIGATVDRSTHRGRSGVPRHREFCIAIAARERAIL